MRLSLFVSKRFISNVDELRFILSKAYFSYLGTLMYVCCVSCFSFAKCSIGKGGLESNFCVRDQYQTDCLVVVTETADDVISKNWLDS